MSSSQMRVISSAFKPVFEVTTQRLYWRMGQASRLSAAAVGRLSERLVCEASDPSRKPRHAPRETRPALLAAQPPHAGLPRNVRETHLLRGPNASAHAQA